jgi:hypothetical protein
MTVDASRSCLGLGTCVGSVIRQIMEAMVLLTATAPPALPGSRMSDGSLAPPFDAITRLLRSACRHRREHCRRQQLGVSARALDLDEVAMAEVGKARGVEWNHRGAKYARRLITPLATGFLTLAAYPRLTGAGEALQVGAVFACLGGYFGERRGTFMSIVRLLWPGRALGPVLGARLFVWYGAWELPFYVFGGAGILVVLVIAADFP